MFCHSFVPISFSWSFSQHNTFSFCLFVFQLKKSFRSPLGNDSAEGKDWWRTDWWILLLIIVAFLLQYMVYLRSKWAKRCFMQSSFICNQVTGQKSRHLQRIFQKETLHFAILWVQNLLYYSWHDTGLFFVKSFTKKRRGLVLRRNLQTCGQPRRYL